MLNVPGASRHKVGGEVTASLVHAGMVDNKKENSDWKMIADEQGVVKQTWRLNDSGVAILLLDGHGNIRYLLNQQPSERDRKEIISSLKALIIENQTNQ